MNETESILGMLILNQLDDIRELALLTAEPWRAPLRPVRRWTRRAGAPEYDLCYGGSEPRECACA